MNDASTVAKMMNIIVVIEIAALDVPLPSSTCKYQLKYCQRLC